MKNQISKSITDPEKILDFLSEEQSDLLTFYLTKGVASYYESIMEENTRIEEENTRLGKELNRVKRLLSDYHKAVGYLMTPNQLLIPKLAADFGFTPGLN